MAQAVVIMGVAGCGKSSLARALAAKLGWHLIEGDDFHSASSRDKMSHGIALTDADRAGWLAALGAEMQRYPAGVVLSCSASKQAYRERLRSAVPDVHFAFLEIDKEEALLRVKARSAAHFFSATLVDDQFATLEVPVSEPRVLQLQAIDALPVLTAQLAQWLAASNDNRSDVCNG